MYIVINGGGKVASSLAHTLIEKGHTVAVIEKRMEVAEKLAGELNGHGLIICGDGCDYQYQDDAGVGRADVFVAATGDDDDNLVSAQLAKAAFEVPRAISRVNNPKNQKIFNTLGIEAISSTQIISRMIEAETTIGDLHTLKLLRKGNLALADIEIEAGAHADGKSIGALKLPANCKIIAVIHSDGDEVDIASAGTVLSAGDGVLALLGPDSERALEKVLNGE